MTAIVSRLCLLVIGVAFAAGPAFAQAPSSGPGKAAPGAPAQSLSKKLSRSNGVIHPKEVDPGIEKPPPKAGDPNVIPPPGTAGGPPAPQPK